MKKLLTLSFLAISCCIFAQYTPREIEKLRIAKLITIAETKGTRSLQKTEVWYDEYGNDTAEYNNGQLLRRTKYEYNSKGQILSRTRIGADNKETETATFTYNPDGSYVISNTDKGFGMTELTYCEKNDRIIKTVAPDKSERIYAYDSRGKLTKIRSNSSDSGSMMTDIHYSYNAKGQLIKETSKGDYKWTSSYYYDRRGLVTRAKKDSETDGVVDPEVNYSYEYEFRK